MSEEVEHEVITMQVSALDRPEWAVVHDAGATCDLTYQEARQMVKALIQAGSGGATIVTNRVGQIAQKQGYLRTPEQN